MTWISKPGGAGDYWRQMFPTPPPIGSFGHWKYLTTGWNVAQRLWSVRCAGADSVPERSRAQHRMIALWMPAVWSMGCADCTWLGRFLDSRDADHQGQPVLASRELPPRHGLHPRPMRYGVEPWPGIVRDPAKVVLTDVDLDGQTLLVLPRDLVVSTLTTWACLKHATEFGHTREDAEACRLVENHLDVWLEARRSHGDEDNVGADQDAFDVDEFFGDDANVWTPVARLLTYEFLSSAEPELAEQYCRPDTSWGFDYEPSPWVHVDDRANVEADLTTQGYQIRRWLGLAEMYLDPPVRPEEELGI